MKRVLLLLSIVLLFYGCPGDWEERSEYHPILMDRSVLESTVGVEAPKSLEAPGKIYYKSNMIYISERYKGVHVIDNSDPAAPKNIAFISAAGCVDMAIKNDIMYLDNAVDLVAIDLTTQKLVKRIKNVFPEPYPPDLNFMPSEFEQGNRGDDKIIVGWKLINE